MGVLADHKITKISILSSHEKGKFDPGIFQVRTSIRERGSISINVHNGTGKISSGMLCIIWSPRVKKDKLKLEQVWRSTVRMIRKREKLSVERKLQEFGLFSLTKPG